MFLFSKAEELLRGLDTSGDGEVNWSEFMAAIEQIEGDLYDRSDNAVLVESSDFHRSPHALSGVVSAASRAIPSCWTTISSRNLRYSGQRPACAGRMEVV